MAAGGTRTWVRRVGGDGHTHRTKRTRNTVRHKIGGRSSAAVMRAPENTRNARRTPTKRPASWYASDRVSCARAEEDMATRPHMRGRARTRTYVSGRAHVGRREVEAECGHDGNGNACDRGHYPYNKPNLLKYGRTPGGRRRVSGPPLGDGGRHVNYKGDYR